jgi:hypothetical protein
MFERRHVHVAEKLGIPLQLFFLQPWTPTTKFPHPFSNLPYSLKDSTLNRLSYYAVDGFFWAMGMKVRRRRGPACAPWAQFWSPIAADTH